MASKDAGAPSPSWPIPPHAPPALPPPPSWRATSARMVLARARAHQVDASQLQPIRNRFAGKRMYVSARWLVFAHVMARRPTSTLECVGSRASCGRRHRTFARHVQRVAAVLASYTRRPRYRVIRVQWLGLRSRALQQLGCRRSLHNREPGCAPVLKAERVNPLPIPRDFAWGGRFGRRATARAAVGGALTLARSRPMHRASPGPPSPVGSANDFLVSSPDVTSCHRMSQGDRERSRQCRKNVARCREMSKCRGVSRKIVRVHEASTVTST